jgi:Archaeal/vacuolar-type H+-ATPase subunit I
VRIGAFAVSHAAMMEVFWCSEGSQMEQEIQTGSSLFLEILSCVD